MIRLLGVDPRVLLVCNLRSLILATFLLIFLNSPSGHSKITKRIIHFTTIRFFMSRLFGFINRPRIILIYSYLDPSKSVTELLFGLMNGLCSHI